MNDFPSEPENGFWWYLFVATTFFVAVGIYWMLTHYPWGGVHI